jgi:hypothetical protein
LSFLWLAYATPRRRERAVRMVASLVIGAFIMWMALGLLLQMATLYDTIGSSKH